MLKTLRKMKGQSTLEYAVLVVVVIAALLSIQVYIRRGVSGRLRDSADQIGDQFEFGNTNAYTQTVTHSNTSDDYTTGVSRTTLLQDEDTTTTSHTNIIDVTLTNWN